MNKIITAAFVAALMLTGCNKSNVTENSTEPWGSKAVRWFDCYHDDMRDDVKEYTVEQFPGVTFRCGANNVTAVTENGEKSLYSGMPIWSVYLCDLTGDGCPELCSTVSIGSGIVDDRIQVYDYARGELYDLSGRGEFDYVLRMENDALVVEKRVYSSEEVIETAGLEFPGDFVKCEDQS